MFPNLNLLIDEMGAHKSTHLFLLLRNPVLMLSLEVQEHHLERREVASGRVIFVSMGLIST